MFKRMPTEKVVYTSGGSNLLTAIAIVFVILKLTGTTAVATWSWWWVLAPLWIPVALVFGILIIALIIIVIGAAIAAYSK